MEGTYGTEHECIQGFGRKSWRKDSTWNTQAQMKWYKNVCEKQDDSMWCGFTCLRNGSSGSHFLTSWVTINFWRTLLHGLCSSVRTYPPMCTHSNHSHLIQNGFNFNHINLPGLPLGFSGYVCVGFPLSSTYLMARQRFWSKLEKTFSSRNVKRPANIK
jgi:hypothetical protein